MLVHCHTADALGLVRFSIGIYTEELANIPEEYAELFKGIGCLTRKTIKLHIDQSIQLVAMRHRMIVFHLRPKVQEELAKLEKAGTIE